ncbi:MAG: hypothetical protein JTJ18_14865 [Streptococcus sp.]|nr:hypothetical protein [Streptococcus sp.]
METKIDLNNLEKENIGKIEDRLCDLIDDPGDVFLWTGDSIPTKKPGRFSSEENAKEYGILKNEYYMRRGIVKRDEPIAYIIGTEKDYQNAVKAWQRRKKNEEVRKFREHVDKLVDRTNKEIIALKALKDVCSTFDGKVINKRFLDAAKAATGFSCSFYEGCLELSAINSYGEYAPGIAFYGSWGSQKGKEWEWFTGDRMEAEKALGVIDGYIWDKRQDIARYKDSIKHYAKYVDQVRKIQSSIRKLLEIDGTIRSWAREHDLERNPLFSHIWAC